jgi:hypothetical protein
MSAIDTPEVVALLRELGQRVALRGGNHYRANAYARAAESLATRRRLSRFAPPAALLHSSPSSFALAATSNSVPLRQSNGQLLERGAVGDVIAQVPYVHLGPIFAIVEIASFDHWRFRPHSSSASRFIAGAAGFFTLIQS